MKNEQKKEEIQVSSYKTQNCVIEEIYDPFRVPEKQFAVFDKGSGDIAYHDAVELENGKALIPNSSTLIDASVILLAEEAAQYTSEDELIQEIQSFISKYVDIHPFYLQLTSYYVLLTWVYDRLSIIPYLRSIGDYGSGKTRFVQVIGSLCYNPMFIAGAVTVSPIFRMIEQFQGTMVFNEMDLSDNNNDLYAEITKILNCGYEKGLVVIRTEGDKKREVKTYKTFCPKIFAMRAKFGDHALESRIISIPMFQTQRKDIPRLLPESFWDEAKRIRNKLLTYRLKHVDELFIEENLPTIEGIEPRLEQILIPLLSVISDSKTKEDIIAFAKNFQEQLIADRGLDFDVIVASQLIELFSLNEKVTVKMVADEVNKEYPERKTPFSSQAIGKVIRNKLNFKTKKIQGNYYVQFDDVLISYLKSRYGIESPQNPPNLQAKLPGEVELVESVDLDNSIED